MNNSHPEEALAAITPGDGSFQISTIQVGLPAAEEVRVKIKAAGICHTDWDSLSWGQQLVLGHEGAGVVDAVGEGVTQVAVGDPVLLNWAISCGHCFQCAIGNHALCETHSPVAGLDPDKGHAHLNGTRLGGNPIKRSFNIGTLSGYTLVRKEAVIKMPPGIPFSSACIVGCGVMTGYGSVVNAARVMPGSSVVVLGCGGVGLNVIQGAQLAGALSIIAIDLHPRRLDMARQFGATRLIQARKEDQQLLDAAQQVKALTQNRGADFAFECTGVPALGAAPLAMVRHGGMALQVSGIEQDLTIDMNLFEWDKVYLNPLYGKCNPTVDFPRLFQLYQQRQWLLDELVTQTYSLHQLGQAFEEMLAGKNAKGVILFEA